jgi:cytochrome c oxidase subunit 3
MMNSHADTGTTHAALEERTRLGIWVFLASEIMFFGPVFFAYAMGRYELPLAFAQASRATDLLSGTLNTAVLLTSSLTMALAVKFAQLDLRQAARKALDGTVLLAVLFLAVKGHEYIQDWQEHLVPGTGFHLEGAANPQGAELFYFVYFVSTLLHSLHLLIGIAMLVFMRWRLRHPVTAAETRRLDAIGLYWHFVDIVWIFLFPALYLVDRAQ